MINPPRTRAEAEKHRYNKWAGNPQGNPYHADRCAYSVLKRGRSPLFYQCLYKPKAGPDNLYCGIHAKLVSHGA